MRLRPMMSALWIMLVVLLTSAAAQARVERFAVIVGSDRGEPGEIALRFAERDARRVQDVLLALGGFEAVNTTLLVGSDAETVRDAIITVNDRVRSALALPGTEVMLFVYYSGHADADALHLGDSRLGLDELARLVRGSAASFRMLVVDACQSGSLTRRKGGRITAPFAITEERIAGEGLALLTASAANEDAQESDELEGSFFTHALVTGLLGAADRDRDGNVVLEEAYRYAYEATLRNTSRTAFGIQHPTFSYDLHGQGHLVLTRLRDGRSARGLMELPEGATYLVLEGGPEGPVIAELGLAHPIRTLSLAPGSYFVRGRARGYLLEGTEVVRKGASTRVDAAELTRVEYAQLARKGLSGTRRHAHGVEVGGMMHTTLKSASRPSYGAFSGYRFDGTHASLAARFGYCTTATDGQYVDTRMGEYALTLRVAIVRDLSPRVSVDLGAGASFVYFTQKYETRGLAPDRRTLGGAAELYAALSVDVHGGVYLTFDATARTYAFEVEEPRGDPTLRAVFAAALSAGFGRRF